MSDIKHNSTKRKANRKSKRSSEKNGEEDTVVDDDKLRSKNNETETEWYRGACKWFNKSKGWGFITLKFDEGGGKDGLDGDIFVYQASIVKNGFRCLQLGEEVECQVNRTDRGWEAVKVRSMEGLIKSEKRQKKVRCFNCGKIARHLASSCPQPTLPKTCHQCKV